MSTGVAPSGDPISRLVRAGVDRVIQLLPMLEPMRTVTETIARFAGVGGASSVLYALIVILAVSIFRLNHDLSALLAYALTMPFNFLLHRQVTFHSVGVVRTDVARYVILQAANIGLSIGAMALSVDGFALPYWVGILAAVLLVPVVTFFVMDRWVFRDQAA